jgi:hypothetical protein
LITNKDAELLVNRLLKQYPVSERPAMPPLAQRGDRHQRDHPADDKSDRRMRRNEHRRHNDGDNRAKRANPHHHGNDEQRDQACRRCAVTPMVDVP